MGILFFLWEICVNTCGIEEFGNTIVRMSHQGYYNRTTTENRRAIRSAVYEILKDTYVTLYYDNYDNGNLLLFIITFVADYILSFKTLTVNLLRF